MNNIDEITSNSFEFGKYGVFLEKIQKDEENSKPGSFVAKPSLTDEFLKNYLDGKTEPMRVVFVCPVQEQIDKSIPKDKQINVLHEGLGKYNELAVGGPKVFVTPGKLHPGGIYATNAVISDVYDYQCGFPPDKKIPTVLVVYKMPDKLVAEMEALVYVIDEWRLGKFSVILYSVGSVDEIPAGTLNLAIQANASVQVRKQS